MSSQNDQTSALIARRIASDPYLSGQPAGTTFTISEAMKAYNERFPQEKESMIAIFRGIRVLRVHDLLPPPIRNNEGLVFQTTVEFISFGQEALTEVDKYPPLPPLRTHRTLAGRFFG